MRNRFCSICGNQGIEPIDVPEVRMGLREEHTYLYCNSCGFLEIETVPDKLSLYYSNYYTAQKKYYALSSLRQFVWSTRALLYSSFLHPLINRLAFNTILDWKHRLKIGRAHV